VSSVTRALRWLRRLTSSASRALSSLVLIMLSLKKATARAMPPISSRRSVPPMAVVTSPLAKSVIDTDKSPIGRVMLRAMVSTAAPLTSNASSISADAMASVLAASAFLPPTVLAS